ncbi:MAG TPA: hypothetical protein VH393_02805 [Ktedonobacterales bacterium]|jgi:hypothetical protein
MDPATQPLDALLWWRNILLICAFMLLAEAGALTFLTSLWRRPWYERLLALAPLVVFVWAVLAARQTHDAYMAMQEYATFIRAHYPEEFVWRGGELTAMAEQVSRSGSPVMMATIGALALGALLLLTHWREAKRQPLAEETTAHEDYSAGELEIIVQGLRDLHSADGESAPT